MMNNDKITIFCESDLSENINIILRQTDYDEKTARDMLIKHNNDPIKTIKEFMGIIEKPKNVKKTINQEIYAQLRHKLDDSIKVYNNSQETKLKTEINL